MTVTVLVLVLVLLLAVGEVEAGVSVTVEGGRTVMAAVVVTVDVEVDVEIDVLVVPAGLSTPQAMRVSKPVELWLPVSSPWSNTIDEPSGPLSWSLVKASLVATSFPEPSERRRRGGKSPLAGCPVCPDA